jgi:amino acid adenylation domain-containing protein
MAEAVAIIGMACRLPGASNEQSLWDLLESGGSAIGPVPVDRWPVEGYHDPVYGTAGRTVMRRGGFLDRIDSFDERFFAISPREARAMDPQQRMLLEETWHCLEDAGLKPSSLSGRKVGVFAGVMATDYQQNATQPGAVTDGFSALGTYGAILANRISHFFGWNGPSYTLDAACASSLVALHEARRALLHGDCELAVVAAANALINPWRSISFSHARMLSGDGESRTFDAGASGYVQGEGAVVVVLARHGDVARLGVRARALVLGSAVNHVGSARGITQPSVASQRAVIEAALADAGVTADTISYVEAHGTGTALGDPIEVAALSAALSGWRNTPCGIGALKTNIGHLEAAAGLAGIAKVVLMLERRRLLPTRNLAETNPLIDFDAGPLRPVTTAMDWIGDPLRAGVSSFGFGGANAHVVLESAPQDAAVRRLAEAATQPFVLSAASPASLEALRHAMQVVAGQDGTSLAAVCQTLMQRRDALPYRLAGMVTEWPDVATLLAGAEIVPPPPRPPRVALRFGGIEKLWDGVWLPMQRDLPAIADAYDEAEAEACAQGARRSQRLVTMARMHAIGSVLMRAGIVPDVLYGEGIGFWVTLALAGVVTLADAVAASDQDRPGPLAFRRPRLAVYDRGTDRVLDPHAVGPDYLSALREGLDAALPDVTRFAAYGARLHRSNRTFRTFFADWAPAFAIRGVAAPDALLAAPPADAAAARLLVLAVAVARRRTCARWIIPETGPLLPAPADELAHLVAAGALPIDAAAALADDAPDAAALSARLDLSVLPPALAAAELPLLSAESSEVADLDAWLRSYPNRPRQPADLTFDIGTLGVEAEGQHLALPLGHGFHARLCQAMCLHWQAGGDTKWGLLAQPHIPVSLPLYPFDRRRHWIPLDHRGAATRPEAAVQPEPAGKPDQHADQITTVSGVPTYRVVWSPLMGEPEPLPSPLGVLGGGTALTDALPGAVVIDGGNAAGAIAAAGCRGVVIGWPLQYAAMTPDRAGTEAFENGCLLPLLKLAKELARRVEPLTVVLVGADGGGDAPRFSPALAAASALLKSVAAEVPSLTVGAVSVTLGPDALRAAAPLLGAAIGTPLGEASVRRDGACVRRIEQTALGFSPDGDHTGAWLIVGGLGGIGAALARHVRAVHGGSVAVLGRRTGAEAAADLAAWADSGTAPLYLPADVTDPDAVAAAIERIEVALGPIGTVVHAEMVLADAAVERMTEVAFAAAWRPKAYGLTTMQAAFAARRPSGGWPRTVVFGSILGLTGNAGQANYAAGSAYQMALAENLAAAGADLRTIAWGYWGEAGRVADATHRRGVARIGLQPMATADGLAAFDAVLAGRQTAVVVARLDAGRAAALSALPEAKPGIAGLDALDTLAAARLHTAFAATGWVGDFDDPEVFGVAPDQRRLFQAAGAILRRMGWDAAGAPDPDVLSTELRGSRPWLAGVIRLIDTAVPRIADVLRGTVPGTQVMFPGGEMDLVAGFYAGNRLADAANRVTARRVAELVAERLTAMPADATLRILEVGAGTGATTAPVLDALAPHGGRIAYVFSDLSAAFIRRARRLFGAQRPWFSAARFDFDGDPVDFEVLGHFDLILAANAVHVTADIADMLERLSRRLAPGGLLVLNELMRPMDHLTLTFGLLPGWWVAADVRAGAGPLLSPDGWRAALADRFDGVSLDGVRDRNGLVQGVLAATLRPVVAPLASDVAAGDALMARVAAIVAGVVEAAADSLAPDTNFADLGLDSILSLELVDRIAETFGITLDPSAITEHATTSRLSALIAARGGASAKPVPAPTLVAAPAPAPAIIARKTGVSGKVAIVGMAGVLPGAGNLTAFMARLAAGETGIGPLPAGRWSVRETELWGADALRDMKAGFVADAGRFDAALFGLSAREAMLMDPQQRLLLEQAWAALADAGRPHLADGAAGSTGVFVGASAGDWTLKLALAGRAMEAQSLSAQLPSSLAARLSHVFALGGPAITVDLACASGLGALHLAVEALGRGECRLALVAGVSLMTTPQFPMLVARAGLLSPSGRPRPFAPDSDGIVLGEGALVLVLKPLDRARADGDRIHAVVEGTALSQAGAADGLSAPNAAAQALTLGKALAAAGVSVSDIAAIEAHGVGTVAGDAAEHAALSEVLGARAAKLPFDTLKPATGHMLAVSGLAAIARAALAAKGRTLVNGFSLNGACAAVVLGAGESGKTDRTAGEPRVIAISATLEAELYERLAALRSWLRSSRPSVADVAAVLGSPRPTAPWRAAFDAADTAALERAVERAIAARGDGPDWRIGRVGRGVPSMADADPMAHAARIVAGLPGPSAGGTAAQQPARPYGYPFISKIAWPVVSHGKDANPPPLALAGDMVPDAPRDPLAVIGRALALDGPLEAEAVLLDLGVDSILAIEIRNCLASEAGLAVGLGDLLARRPIGAMLAAAGSAEAVEQIAPDPANRMRPFGLTDLQLAYFVGRSPAVPLGGTGCHVYWEFQSDSALDVERLEGAWNRLVEAHDMLRAVFSADATQWVQSEVPPTRIAVHDWRAANDGGVAALAALRDRMAHEVFDPTHWPLFRIELSHSSLGSRLHVSIDLLIVDVLSLFGLLRQWGRLYASPDSQVAAPAISFRDYVGYLERRKQGAAHARALAFWRDEIARLPDAPALPRARPDQALVGARFVRRRGELDPAAWQRLQTAARACGATPAAVLVTAFGAALAHWTGEDFAINVTVYDRRPVHPDIDRVIGDFTSTILLAAGSDSAGGFGARARATSSDLARRLEHTAVSGVEALRRFGQGRGVPFVFTSMLGYDPVIGAEAGITSLGRLDHGVTQTPQVLLDAQAYCEGGRLVFTWDIVEEAFPEGLIGALFGAYAGTIARLAAAGADWTNSATVAIAAEEAARRAVINATTAPVGGDLLHEPLLRHALAVPERVAIIAPEVTWTFGDLVRHAVAIAAALPPPGRDELIVVALDKSALQIAAVLGVLMAGGAYLPLDPNLPPARFRRLVERGEARTVVTTAALAARLSLPPGVTVVAADRLKPGVLPATLPPRRADCPDLAYVIFTSGSTGEPKGVMIEHRAALNTVLDVNRRFGVGADDRVLGLSALGFDLSVYDIFGPLAVGGALVLPDPAQIRDPDVLAALTATAGVTIWNSVPMFLDLLLAAEPAAASLSSLRLALLSGDWIPLGLPPALAAVAPHVRLVSLGGATEAAIWSICHEVGALDPAWRSVPYGRPMANQTFHVLDADMQPCPDGVEGELYIGGLGVARGYWRDRERTASAFVSDPRNGQLLYRTGDMGRWRDGVIEFLGRRDGQVKIGGYRVELAEVEAAALSHACVGHAVALATAGEAGRRQLLLFVTGADPDPAALRAHLAASLPAYMVPQRITVLAALPLTGNGKVDRAALLARIDAAAAASAETAMGPGHGSPRRQADLVAAIGRILTEALGGRAVDPDVSFFELGADSLTAVAVNLRLRRDLGLKSSVTDLFEHPSVSRLARHFAGWREGPVAPPMPQPVALPPSATAQDRRAALRRDFRNRADLAQFASGVPGA